LRCLSCTWAAHSERIKPWKVHSQIPILRRTWIDREDERAPGKGRSAGGGRDCLDRNRRLPTNSVRRLISPLSRSIGLFEWIMVR
jgi:hypothetical protein